MSKIDKFKRLLEKLKAENCEIAQSISNDKCMSEFVRVHKQYKYNITLDIIKRMEAIFSSVDVFN